MLYIVGLGAGSLGQMTLETYELLTAGHPNYLRTAIHPAAAELEKKGVPFTTFDHLYEAAQDFEDIYKQIAAELVEQAQEGADVVYAVPGNPVFGERSVVILREMLAAAGLDYQILSATSFVDHTMTALGVDVAAGLTIVDGLTLEEQQLDKARGNLILQVYSRAVMSAVKLRLMEDYPDDYPVTILYHAGIPGEEAVTTLPLYEIDRQDQVDHLTSLYLPPMADAAEPYAELLNIMVTLRSPEGCPWDREQTRESIKPYLLEEAYEVIDAIETGDVDNLVEELGDVLFQVVFHARLGEEAGEFTMDDVIAGVNEKMIRRHPHVFKTQEEITSGEVLVNWDEIKKQEKEAMSLSEEMRRVPAAFTALMAAAKVSAKAAKVGFDWEDALAANEKVAEETLEVAEALRAGEKEQVEEELGDLLFAVANVARLAGVQPELALKKGTAKFVERFTRLEKKVEKTGGDLKKMDIDELEELWQAAKAHKI